MLHRLCRPQSIRLSFGLANFIDHNRSPADDDEREGLRRDQRSRVANVRFDFFPTVPLRSPMAHEKEVHGSNKRSAGDHSDTGGSNQNELHWWTEINKRLKQSQEDHQNLRYEKLKELEDYFLGEQKTEERWQQEFDSLKLQLQTLEAKHDIKMRKLKLELAEGKAKIKLKESDTNMEKMKNVQDCLADAKRKVIQIDELEKTLYKEKLKLKYDKVFCRVRPFSLDKGAEHCESVISYPTSVESRGRGIELSQSGKIYQFPFDKVFSGDASQQELFDEISELIQSALDGYKVFIFSYGQTGSGKTYTMMGKPIDDPDQKGLIPRSLEKIYQATQLLSAHGREYKLQASVSEIYNETTCDLLDENRNTHFRDLTTVDVCSIDDISLLLERTANIWCVGKTQINEESSRSHMVFTLQISKINKGIEQVQGIVNFVELAGSEHLSNSKATGDRLKETQVINKSLLYLSNVVCGLAKKKDHVPFRNSTYFLEPYQARDSKTLMVVNIPPNPSSADESLCSLQFAELMAVR